MNYRTPQANSAGEIPASELDLYKRMRSRSPHKNRRVVITGMGAVTPLGHSVAETWKGLTEGRCGVGPISVFDASRFETRIAAEVRNFPFESMNGIAEMAAVFDRKNAFGYAAALQAMADAGLLLDEPMLSVVAMAGGAEASTIGHETPRGGAEGKGAGPRANGHQGLEGAVEPSRFGISLGTEGRRDALLPELGARKLLPHTAEERRAAIEQAPATEFLRYSPYGLSYALGAVFGARGPISTISTACTSSSQALGYAVEKIRSGEADIMLTGGAECLMEPMQVAGFILLGALSKRNDEPQRASRPFDAARDGFVLAEGAAMLVVEDAWHAYRRGARIYGEIAGFGCSINAYRITDSPPDGQGPYLAMTAALRDAGMTPEDIDYINAHGTSTVQNDSSETMAIKRSMGEHAYRVPVSSTKSMTGHMVNAAGAIEAIISTMAIREGFIPPTINYENPDPVCDLDYVPNQGRRARVRAVLSNSFGFGGSNGSILIREYVS
jgi:3-oxoacyl-[acyl-carrier-protein] synthase II